MSRQRFLLDTNIVIGLVKGPGVARDLVDRRGAQPEVSAVSQITRMELLSFPAITADEEAKLHALLAAVTVILMDERIEQETIILRRRTRLKLPDAIIAAIALVHGLTLVTLDEKLNAAFGN